MRWIFSSKTRSRIRPLSPLGQKAAVLTLAVILATMAVFSPSPVEAADAGQRFPSLGYLSGGIIRMNYRFVVATDSHLGSGQGNAKTKAAFSDMAQHVKDASFMVHMGDITETGAPGEYDLFAEYLPGLPFEVYATRGNHESRWQDPTGSVFSSRLGASSYSFDYGAWHFVVLDTTWPTQTLGTLDASVLSWLEKDLAAQPKNRPVAVFSHHPLCYEPQAFQDADDAFLDLVKRYPIQVVFSGHGHSFITWKTEGRTFQMVGALMDAAYSVVEVKGVEMSIYSVTNAGTPERVMKLEASVSGTAPSSPLSNMSASYADGILTIGFDLSAPASISLQLDGYAYVDHGVRQPGHHELTCDIAGYAKGTHTLRVRAATPAGSWYEHAEFSKDADDLLLWSRDLGSNVTGNLTRLGPDKAIVGTSDGVIRCLKIETGDIVWEYRAGSPWGGGTVNDGRLYFGTADGRLFSVDAASGTLIWQSGCQGASFVSAPLVYDQGSGKSVAIGSASGAVYSFSVFTGLRRWTASAKGAVVSTPCAGSGKVFFGAWDNTLYAVDDATGTISWTRQLGRQIYYSPYHSPVFQAGKVFATIPYDSIPGASYLYALDAATGETVWTYSSASSLLTPIMPDKMGSQSLRGQWIVALDGAGRAVCIGVHDGKAAWQSPARSSLFGSVPIGDGIWVSGGSRGVLSITTESGTYEYKVRDSFLFQEPLVTKKAILQADTRGTLWAIKTSE